MLSKKRYRLRSEALLRQGTVIGARVYSRALEEVPRQGRE